MSRRAVMSVLLSAAALALVFLCQRGQHVTPAAPRLPSDGVSEGDREVPVPPQRALQTTSQPDVAPLARHVSDREPARQEATRSRPAPPYDFIVRGTIVIVDADGHDVLANGGFTLVFWYGDTKFVASEPTIESGRFSFRVRAEADLPEVEIEGLTLDGTPAVVEPARLSIPDDHELHLVAHRPRIVLSIVDASTGVHLSGVTLVAGPSISSSTVWDYHHPTGDADEQELLRGVASPLRLPPPGASTDAWCRAIHAVAPGYAWGAVNVDFRASANPCIVLDRGGELSVVMANPDLVDRYQARQAESSANLMRIVVRRVLNDVKVRDLRRDWRAEVASAVASATAPNVFPGLAQGRYEVCAETPERILASTEVDVIRGAIVSVTLAVTDMPSPVPFAGTLAIPRTWGNLAFDLWLWSLAVAGEPDETRWVGEIPYRDLVPVEGTPGLHRWSAGLRLPGWYRFTLRWREEQLDLDVGAPITLGSSGNRNVVLALAEPAQLDLHVIDADTGEDAAVSCCSESPSSKHHLRVPTGPFKLWMGGGDDEYPFTTLELDLAPGPNDRTVAMRRACGIDFTFDESGDAVSWCERFPCVDFNCGIVALRADGRDAVNSLSISGDSLRLVLDGPGRFRIQFPFVEGYRPIALFEIELARGQFAARSITFERVR